MKIEDNRTPRELYVDTWLHAWQHENYMYNKLGVLKGETLRDWLKTQYDRMVATNSVPNATYSREIYFHFIGTTSEKTMEVKKRIQDVQKVMEQIFKPVKTKKEK